jgi:hypothetical protein
MSMRRRSVIAGIITLLLVADAVMTGSSASKAATGGSQRRASVAAQGSPLIAFLRYTPTTPSVVWITRPTGGVPRRLGPGAQPLISPAGGYYVAATAINSKRSAMLIYSTEGGTPRGFFSSDQLIATPLAWSPNGRYLAVSLLGTAVNSTRGSGLAVVDTQTWSTTIVARGVIYGASFDPTGSGELVYASASSQLLKAPANLHTVSVTGGATTMLTHDGGSLFPVWGATGIVFDRETRRGVAKAPAYQVWLMRGSHVLQLTSLKIPSLLDGLVPLAVSANGNRIIAEYGGEDTSDAWTIQISPREVSQVKIGDQDVQAAGISRDGTRLLVGVGAFEQSAGHGSVETMTFGGGGVVNVTQGVEASWNG